LTPYCRRQNIVQHGIVRATKQQCIRGLNMRRSFLATALTVLPLILAGAGHGLACNGDKVLLDEDFSFQDAAWGDADKNFAIKDGSAFLRPDVSRGYKALNQGFLFGDADICLTVTAVDISKPEDAAGGLAFWAKDFKNAFFLLIAANGYVKIGRLVNGAWVSAPFDWTQSDAVKQGLNQQNKLHIAIKGQTLAFDVNGKAIGKLRAQSPGGDSMVGIYGESSDKVDSWKFNDLKVTNIK